MAEGREIHTERIFGATSKRGDEQKAFTKAKRNERHFRNLAQAVSLGVEKANCKLKQFFNLKPSSTQSKIPQPKETPVTSHHHEANSFRQHRASFKKPPFIVPGVIRHNDVHLIQEFPHAKYNTSVTKKGLKPTVKPGHQSGPTKQAVVKTHASTLKKPSSSAIAPESQGFVAPREIRPNCGIFSKITSRIKEVHHTEIEDNPTERKDSVVFTPRNRVNPFITLSREFSEQKRFSSLVASDSGTHLPVPYFMEDDSDQDFCSSSDVEDENVNSGEGTKNLSLKSDNDNPTAVKQNTASPSKREAAQHLREQMDEAKFRLEELCCEWSTLLEEEEGNIPQDETGSVITVIRQTEQLQRERFHQYSTLIDQFEHNSGEKMITTSDLEGFWEMILLQVADVEKKFAKLDQLHKNGWIRHDDIESQEDQDKHQRKKTGRKKSTSKDGAEAKSGIRSHIAALRKKNKSSPAVFYVDSSDNQDSPSPQEDSKDEPPILLSDVVLVNESPILPLVHESLGAIALNNPSSSSKDSPIVVEKLSTPHCMKILQSRKKHCSAVFTSFFSPVQTSSPRQRSRSTESYEKQSDAPSSPLLHKRKGIMDYCKFLRIPSQSPTGRKKNPLEKDVETRNMAPKQFDSPSLPKEENNNEPNESFPIEVAVSYHE